MEFIIGLAIIGALTMIAYPSYKDYVDKGRNSRASVDIANLFTSIERYHAVNLHYPATLADLGTIIPLDPWGREYIYLNIADAGPGVKSQVRKDKKLSPINSKFDLYSMGKDGDTANQTSSKTGGDDIILASDGQYIGLAGDF